MRILISQLQRNITNRNIKIRQKVINFYTLLNFKIAKGKKQEESKLVFLFDVPTH